MLSLGWGGGGVLGKDSVILMRGSPGVFEEPWGNTVAREHMARCQEEDGCGSTWSQEWCAFKGTVNAFYQERVGSQWEVLRKK